MTTETAQPNDRLDVGERLFIFAVMETMALASILTLLGICTYFQVSILIIGILDVMVPAWIGNQLYGGKREGLKITFYWTALQAFLTVVLVLLLGALRSSERLGNVGLPGAFGTVLLILQCLTQVGFGLMCLKIRNVQLFLAYKRGEEIAELPEVEA